MGKEEEEEDMINSYSHRNTRRQTAALCVFLSVMFVCYCDRQ